MALHDAVRVNGLRSAPWSGTMGSASARLLPLPLRAGAGPVHAQPRGSGPGRRLHLEQRRLGDLDVVPAGGPLGLSRVPERQDMPADEPGRGPARDCSCGRGDRDLAVVDLDQPAAVPGIRGDRADAPVVPTAQAARCGGPVSYTHLTLPTIYS